MHVEQVQVIPNVVGGFIPAATQSNPAPADADFVSCPGRGASQTVHLSSTESGFESMHSEHVQFPPPTFTDGFSPAATPSKAVPADPVPTSAFFSNDATEKSNTGSEDTGTALAAFRSVM